MTYHSVLRGDLPGGGFDEVEIHDEIQCRDSNDQQAESDAYRAAGVDVWDGVSEESQNHAHEIDEGDSTGGRHYTQLEAIRNSNHTGRVGKEHAKECADRQASGLHYVRELRLQQRRESADASLP